MKSCRTNPLNIRLECTPGSGQIVSIELGYKSRAFGEKAHGNRFVDDILMLAPTRRRLRKAVKRVNAVLGCLRLEKHPDKTFIGRIERASTSWVIASVRRGFPRPQGPSSSSSPVRPGFTSGSRGSLAAPPGLGRTCGVGSGPHAGLGVAATGDCIQNRLRQPDLRPSAPGRS